MPTAGVPFRPAGQDTSKAQVEMANATFSGSDLLKKALRDQVGHTFTEGLRAILHEWARTGSNTFTFVASPERPAFSVRVVDCSDEDQSALLFSVAPLEDLKRCQRFLVSTEGRGLLKQSQDADTRLFPQLRAKLERVSWEELKHFIESHADTVAS
jgi:hypothetical protein